MSLLLNTVVTASYPTCWCNKLKWWMKTADMAVWSCPYVWFISNNVFFFPPFWSTLSCLFLSGYLMLNLYVFCYRQSACVCAHTPAVLRYDLISIRRGQPEKDEVAEEKPHRFYRSQHLFPLFTRSFLSHSTCSLFSHYCHYWWNSSSAFSLLLAEKIKEKGQNEYHHAPVWQLKPA